MLPVATKFIPFRSFTSFDLSFGLGSAHGQELPPGHVFGPTTTKHYIIEYVLKGCGVMEVNGTPFPLKQGDVIVIFPFHVRLQCADERDPWMFAWVNVSGKSADSFFSMLGVTPENPVIPDCADSRVLPIIQELVEAVGRSSEPQRIFASGAQLLSLFDELWGIVKSRGNYADTGSAKNYVAQAATYMDLHYADKNLTVDSIAHALGLNRSYLYKLFKNELDMSPQEYLMRLRINKGCELLIIPKIKITSVAYSVGYEPLVFTKVFKRFMGMTPSEYRKLKLKQ